MNIPATLTNPQPKRDIRFIAMNHLVTATVTYSAEGKPIALGLRADKATEETNKQLAMFSDMTSKALSEGNTVDDIERWFTDAGLARLAEPLLSILREPAA